MLVATKGLVETTAVNVGNLVSDSVELGFTNVSKKLVAIEERQAKITEILNRMVNALIKHGIPFESN